MGKGFMIPSEGIRNTMDRGAKIPWVGGSIYHGYDAQDTMGGGGSIYPGERVRYTMNRGC
jgi:hypothetical protein